MNSLQNRANSVMAFSLSAIFCLLGAIALSALLIPSHPSGSVALDSIKVVTGRYDKNWVDYKTRDNQFANTVMKIDADLSSLFHWNTKQLFVYAVAEYSTKSHPKNQIVLWDSIIKRKSDAVIKKQNINNKYSLIDVNRKWTDVEANVTLHWNIVPYVGFMTYGHSQSSGGYAFPLPSGIQK
ncbi:signal peptidase complex subunit 3 [Entomortierella parvispora]|uniref:Signal peptidase subunit 3 n=1 Tax=Entomortierella parvispora TaxID=205924 RepID=A0A9P3HH61_9FUNG|nr:signal peptidase complex subunit 3 [Entomortierella parvispora]